MREWAEDDPKADLMARKRGQITAAARESFLRDGFAGSSVNRIADAAEVSIKTLYRHFESKDDLFSAVMLQACAANLDEDRTWADLEPGQGLVRAAEALLAAVLSPDQVALQRVVLAEGARVPAVADAYRATFLDRRFAMLADYFVRWPEQLDGALRNPLGAARTFNALVASDFVERALLGEQPGADELRAHAEAAAAQFLALVRERAL